MCQCACSKDSPSWQAHDADIFLSYSEAGVLCTSGHTASVTVMPSSDLKRQTRRMSRKRRREDSVTLTPKKRRRSVVSIKNESESSSDEDNTSEYKYTRLEPGQIRILTVHPRLQDSIDSRVNCTISIRDRQPKPEVSPRKRSKKQTYEALSYVWGIEGPVHPIHISSRSGGQKIMKVTPNLLKALRHLRREEEERHFWIDAVCINQEDESEKNQQVPLMSQVYSEATNVCVWLGEEDESSTLAMDLLPKIRVRDLENFEEHVEKRTTCEEWAALIKLMGRRWFTRRWVVQEIALAKQASLHCGMKEISWSDFSEAIDLFKDVADQVSQKFRASKAFKHNSHYVGNVSAYAASRLVAATSRIVRKSEDNRVLMKVRTLEYLVSTLTPFEAKISADSIYAVLSLARDIPGTSTVITPLANIDTEADEVFQQGLTAEEKRMAKRAIAKMRPEKYPVDYGKSFYEVCTDFLRFVFRNSKSLDMICRPWAPRSGSKEEIMRLPSWILTVNDDSYGIRKSNNTMSRKNADVLVGEPGEGVYSASGKYPAEWNITMDDSTYPEMPVLSVKGFVLDEIKKFDDAASAGVVPKTWFSLGKWKNLDEAPPEAFWRTIVADRDGDGGNPPSYYALACRHALSSFNPTGASVSLDQVESNLDHQNVLKRYIQRIQSVIWDRRLAQTKQHSFLALVPGEVKKRDLVCIIPGCSVPIVLRKRTKGEKTYYRFIGESYVHGMMDGEAFEIKRRMDTAYETFNIH